ncbi:hypothetical protein ABT282_37520 [Streptomyces sp. NPDC000927]|uniref:hypothetical protein n=1 Tax=Streptomyces sp. NPDC000927 TaxID=3154371 RepID=UPI00331F23D1
MDRDDEQLLRRRVYGADLDRPGPRPNRRYAELVGGPLDDLPLDITLDTGRGRRRRRVLCWAGKVDLCSMPRALPSAPYPQATFVRAPRHPQGGPRR